LKDPIEQHVFLLAGKVLYHFVVEILLKFRRNCGTKFNYSKSRTFALFFAILKEAFSSSKKALAGDMLCRPDLELWYLIYDFVIEKHPLIKHTVRKH